MYLINQPAEVLADLIIYCLTKNNELFLKDKMRATVTCVHTPYGCLVSFYLHRAQMWERRQLRQTLFTSCVALEKRLNFSGPCLPRRTIERMRRENTHGGTLLLLSNPF